jgi:hypothetical protein
MFMNTSPDRHHRITTVKFHRFFRNRAGIVLLVSTLAMGALTLSSCSSGSSVSAAQRTQIQNQYLKDLAKGTSLKMGDVVTVPTWMDSLYLTSTEMKKGYRVATIQVFGIVTTGATYIGGLNNVSSYETNVDLQVCAGKAGFPGGSNSIFNAGLITQQLWLLPNATSAYSTSADIPTLIPGEPWIENAPSLGPNQCFRGVESYAVPVEVYNLGARTFNPINVISKEGAVALTSSHGPFQAGLSLDWVWKQ